MNYGELKTRVLKLIDEYSSRGTVLTKTKIADIIYKIQGLVNSIQMDLASTYAKLPAIYKIVQNPIENDLSKDTSTIKNHMPGEDFTTERQGARSVFFESTGPAEIYIEEYVNDIWTTLETISIPASQTTFQEYRRLITPSDTSNNIRLRFSGDYIYQFRNYHLYGVTWPDQDFVQQWRPYFLYDLPLDFLKLNYVEVRRQTRQYTSFQDFHLRSDNKIAFNRYISPAEFLVHYFRKPVNLTFTGIDETDDAQTIDVLDEAAEIMPLAIAGEVLISEKDETRGAFLLNMYEARKANLPGGNEDTKGDPDISIYGW